MFDSRAITRALSAAITHAPYPMMITDPSADDNPVIMINAAFTDMTGYSYSDIVGHNCRILQGERTDPAMTMHIRNCIERQRGCIEWVLNYRRDGSTFWNLLFISPVFAPDGSLIHFFGNQRDVSKGLPIDLPDFRLGPANMPIQGQKEFDALLRETLDDPPLAGQDDDAAAQLVERILDRTQRLNEVTTRLASIPFKG